MMQWQIIPFDALTNYQLYAILALREEIFTFEQRCDDPDLDGIDLTSAHLLGTQNQAIIATARISPPGSYVPDKINFGRLAIQKKFRGLGYGGAMMELILQYIKIHFQNFPIEISAQAYLEKFYAKYGFVVHGEPYAEGGIPHVRMLRATL